MSQADYTIADQAGAAFRAELNDHLSAIVSQNSGLTEPVSTFAYQWWADTTTDILKQRNAANSAWINILTLSTGAAASLDGSISSATTATTQSVGDNSTKVATTAYADRVGKDRLFDVDATVAANAMTLTINPTVLDFRSTTLTDGTPVTRTISAAINTVISSGSTGGTTSAVQSDIVIAAIDNAGTVEVAWCNRLGGLDLSESGLISTTAEGGAGAADSAITWYSTTARTNVAYRVLGFARSTQATAGTWATTPSLVQGAGGKALEEFARRFVSSEQTVTGSSVLNVAHGLGFIPSLVRVTLRCKTAEFNYAVNDEVEVNYNYGSGVQYTSVSSDATNVTIILQGAQPTVLNKSTQAISNITLASWKWVVRAWA